MRYAIISDIHSNIEALKVALDDIKNRNIDKIYCCGDLVGYYANPNECLSLLKENNVRSIAGNHDMAAADSNMELSDFWEVARKAIIWTRRELTTESRDDLSNLPDNMVVENRFLLFHGGLHVKSHPERFHLEYETDVLKSTVALEEHGSGVKMAFFGHTHCNLVHRFKNGELISEQVHELKIDPETYYLINPGSIGQSRDGDPRLSYLIYDDKTSLIMFYRLEYDIKSCIRKARKAGIWQFRWIRRLFRLARRIRNRSLRTLFGIY